MSQQSSFDVGIGPSQGRGTNRSIAKQSLFGKDSEKLLDAWELAPDDRCTTDSKGEPSGQALVVTLDLADSLNAKFKDDFGVEQRMSTEPPASTSGWPSAQVRDSEWVVGRPKYVPKDAPNTPTSSDLSFCQPRSTSDVERWLAELEATHPGRSNLNRHKRDINRSRDDFANGELLFEDECGVARHIRTSTVLPVSGSELPSLSAQMQAVGSPQDAPRPPTSFDLSFAKPRSTADADRWLDELAARLRFRANLNNYEREIDHLGDDFANAEFMDTVGVAGQTRTGSVPLASDFDSP
eukprot:CAMPEP_0203932966 /NCGR_PEP_ID=MMETSP0359-20131031/71244_1 /ASSEMBLY_ACC=CAM_ASM_000338 /TAXON_ID=268821 /ORGANISM="Scrippsiella Hangoei, Strain SHTV-5" /LENGTH=295 /DNA_ID=CAMNT_0050862467 /DNA_START=1 /DNA_END=886 /DNA_ORIENTATION=+